MTRKPTTNDYDVNIPPPSDGKKRGYKSKYPFAIMPINASIAKPCGRASTALRTMATQYKVAHPGWDFISRTVIEDGREVVRLWRIS